MMKTGRSTLICTASAVVLFSGMALDAVAAKKKKIDGKEMYKANCKVCHDKNSEAGEYTPMTLIGEQWERFYEKKYVDSHKDLKMPVAEGSNEEPKSVTEAISPEAMEAIKEFTIKHAADSEHPMTCG